MTFFSCWKETAPWNWDGVQMTGVESEQAEAEVGRGDRRKEW
jgi:hypothetical protein